MPRAQILQLSKNPYCNCNAEFHDLSQGFWARSSKSSDDLAALQAQVWGSRNTDADPSTYLHLNAALQLKPLTITCYLLQSMFMLSLSIYNHELES